ncbi:dTDP-Rha:alpha-D-GlcNAc-pyrophosphate polyprenol, alpha-3-L-rhamnosyltransferase [Achromobacter spanius]|uniref:glycosyltransferase family 2 protein n=1 Tax=Achromobacter spanius TaxID=217203 RepID=UPI000D9B9724|nr:glycosyltransferase family 2 protein [Achromobacter spanius]CAB3638586.1 hypothetical protein LMG5911_01488 [Achromobacter spanius]SPT36734.1 dTDP-Rha:alpha-D-GlcNAc-pyrophosphate polyprenol, alpha-3-L-rhamnosyltransferase [Achromobacter denitrificans]VEE56683.1 dTDP-Rha:alpha-D-GlcNAc-pyrophosphate polyprenol, alpha-3-L-rhamnosyltransferase [Achromobacter spanius]
MNTFALAGAATGMPGAPRCSVVIVAFNCWDLLHPCLEALMTQTMPPMRIVVVDNGNESPDDVARLAHHTNLVYVKAAGNLGFAAGNNLGFAHVGDCEWIALLNPDTVPHPEWLARLAQATLDYPQFAFFGSRLLRADNPALLDGNGDCYHVSGYAWRSGINQPATAYSTDNGEIFAPCAAAALYRRDIILAAGGFDEDFFCYMEDVDLGFRLRLAGHRCLGVPGSTVLHAGSAVTGKQSEFYIYHGQRNLVWTFAKNMPGYLFWLFLPLHIALNMLGIARYVRRGNFRGVMRAKWDAIRGLPKIWRKRRVLQRNRSIAPWQLLRVLNKKPYKD